MRVLVIDDEANIRKTTVLALQAMGHETSEAEGGESALGQLESTHFDAAFLDLKLGAESGMELLPRMLKINPNLDVVVFTAYASIETAVEAMRRGAVDYIAKPFTPEQIRQVLSKIVRMRKLEGRLADLEFRLSTDSPTTDLTTVEPAMKKAFDLALKAAGTPATIMLTGESGTGKTVLARAIHENSLQRENAFVTVSCPSLSRDLLESELFGHIKGAFSPARWRRRRGGKFRWRTAVHCFWTRSGICRWNSSRGCCACCRRRNMSAWAKPRRARRMCG